MQYSGQIEARRNNAGPTKPFSPAAAPEPNSTPALQHSEELTMITALRLKNFKAFADTQTLPIKPLTLIFGANSSGKSSLLHGLLFGCHAMETGELDVQLMSISGQSVDLGGFRQYVHRGQTLETVEWAAELDVKQLKISGPLSYVGDAVFENPNAEQLEESIAELLAPARTVRVSVEIGLRHEMKEVPYRAQVEGSSEDVTESTGEMIAVGDPFVKRFEISADGSLMLRMSRLALSLEQDRKMYDATKRLFSDSDVMERLQMDELNYDHPVIRALLSTVVKRKRKMVGSLSEEADRAFRISVDALLPLTDADLEGLRATIDAMIPRFFASVQTLLPETLSFNHIPENEAGGTISAKTGGAFQLRQNEIIPYGHRSRSEDLAEIVRRDLPNALRELVAGLYHVVREQLDRVHYRGPLRSYPPRHMAFSKLDDPAWDSLRSDTAIRQKVNDWLGDKNKLSTPYELTIRHLLTIDDLAEHFQSVAFRMMIAGTGIGDDGAPKPDDRDGEVLDTLNKLKQYEADISQIKELTLVDKRTNTPVSHRDVGIGISQVLPVLVSAFGTSNRIHAIEQPEIHLHPALQAELGDVFIQSALGEQKNTFLLETHSEHLILRILRRVRETTEGTLPAGHSPIRPEDVSVVFVQPGPKGSEVMELPVTPDGDFSKPWPGGFFADRAKELF